MKTAAVSDREDLLRAIREQYTLNWHGIHDHTMGYVHHDPTIQVCWDTTGWTCRGWHQAGTGVFRNRSGEKGGGFNTRRAFND